MTKSRLKNDKKDDIKVYEELCTEFTGAGVICPSGLRAGRPAGRALTSTAQGSTGRTSASSPRGTEP